MTGRQPFEVKDTDELVKVFGEIGNDLQHLYFLGYYPEDNLKIQLATDYGASRQATPL
jgi:hypothetical protein